MLLSASLLPVVVSIAVAALVFVDRVRKPAAVSCLLTIFLTMAVVMLPWGIRNHGRLGALILTRSNFGLELFLSHHPEAAPGFVENGINQHFLRHHPVLNEEEAKLLREVGEVRYNQLKLAQAVDFITADSPRFLRRTASRIFHFWLPLTGNVIKNAFLVCLLAAAALGLWVVWRRSRPLAAVIGCMWTFYPAIYYLMQWDWRYRYPIYWTFFFLSAAALAEGFELAWKRKRIIRQTTGG